LTPQEGFVLSRVDGHTSLGDICMLSGLGEDAAVAILQKLKAVLIIVTSAPMAELPPGIAPASASRPAAGAARGARPATTVPETRPGSGAADAASAPQRAAGTAASGPRPAPGRGAAGPDLERDAGAATLGGAARPVPPLDEAEIDRALLTDGPDLADETRRRILAYHRRLAGLDLFARLELSPSADRQEIRRSYFRLSKEFHPDRFYGKDIGRYREMLGDIFKAISAAFATLSDDGQRARYIAGLSKAGEGAPPERPSRSAAQDRPGGGSRGVPGRGAGDDG
jgi:hypothetical protein